MTIYSEEGLKRVKKKGLFFTVDFDYMFSRKLISVILVATVLAQAPLKMCLLLGKYQTTAELIAGCLSFLPCRPDSLQLSQQASAAGCLSPYP